MVNKTWNCQLLSDLLVDYHDSEILDLIVYGWPVECDDNIPLELGGHNHKGATEFDEVIDAYIEKEKQMGAVLGPFESIPFQGPVAISPLSTQPKRDSQECRIIMDCSWPIGYSLNDSTDKDMYLQKSTELRYPTMDSVCKCIYEMSLQDSQEIWLFKEDLDRAFRQLYGDLKSVPLLGY